MKRLVLVTVFTTAMLIALISCNNEIENIKNNESVALTGSRDELLVDKIYDYHNNLLAEYIYEKNNRLVKRIVTDRIIESYRTIDRRWEDEFEYENGRVSKIKTYTRYIDSFFGNDDESHTENTFEYDLEGKLIKSRDASFRYENGRVEGFLRVNEGPFYVTDTIVYDNSGNVIRHIYIGPELTGFGQPIPGTTKRDVRYYEYDDKPKPNFGLDYLFGYNPLPYIEAPELIGALSKNNMIKATEDGYAFIYTYNEDGLPATIETKWIGVETLEPMLMRITYKKIN